MNKSAPVFLRKPSRHDVAALRVAYVQSAQLHQPWAYPPENYDAYVLQPHRYLLIEKNSQQIAGTFHISGVIKGYFHSAFLGYEAFVPHNNKGYMQVGLKMVVDLAFNKLNLHRLEANIQPGNEASIALVKKAGFVKEGFSKSYLRIGGREWKDHERWAIINEHWRPEL